MSYIRLRSAGPMSAAASRKIPFCCADIPADPTVLACPLFTAGTLKGGIVGLANALRALGRTPGPSALTPGCYRIRPIEALEDILETHRSSLRLSS